MKPLLACAIFLTGLSTVSAQGFGPSELIIEAFVDGPSTLHVTPDGVYWTNGNNAKPGRWHRQDEPTYVNGVAWKRVWGKPGEERGPDKSELYPVKLGTVALNFRLIAISQERGQPGKERRTPPIAKRAGDEFTVIIADPESQPRWYKFSLRKP